ADPGPPPASTPPVDPGPPPDAGTPPPASVPPDNPAAPLPAGPLGADSAPPSAGPPDVRLGPPGRIRRDSARPPDTREPPMAAVPGKPGPRTDESREDRDTPQAIDLPGFAVAVPGVATGLRPFPDGITWLAEKGYRTVLHLRAPGEDTAAARKLFEKKGLKY